MFSRASNDPRVLAELTREVEIAGWDEKPFEKSLRRALKRSGYASWDAIRFLRQVSICPACSA